MLENTFTAPPYPCSRSRFTQFYFLFQVPPNIIDEESSPSSVTIRENHNASLQCSAEGTPKPTITWRREDQKKIIIKRKKNAGKKGDNYYINFKF